MAKDYFDSSVLLTVLLAEPRAEEAAGLWLESPGKVSSILLEAECLNGLRRYVSRMGKKVPSGWLDDRVAYMGECLTDVVTKNIDSEILSQLRSGKNLSDCRTLDAIHLATALYFSVRGEEELRVVSFDAKMRETAAKLGLKTLPA